MKAIQVKRKVKKVVKKIRTVRVMNPYLHLKRRKRKKIRHLMNNLATMKRS